MSRRTFIVTAERGAGSWWVTECAELGCVSQVRRLSQVADDLREAIAYQSGLPEDGFDVKVVPVLPPAYTEAAAAAEEQRELAAESQRRAAELVRDGARVLQAAGLTLRDIGTVMGVSHQRAAQLLN
nr:MAG TPA: antitoxin [Caudoviricetes sp.]